ncbi:MAG: hypothetical protein AAFN70_03840 [Planctomycetota bacterium]
MVTSEDVLSYWLDEVGPKAWYTGGEALDEEIRGRFLTTWYRSVTIVPYGIGS